jgi:N-acetyl-gamma-glutamyl-phosphate/LysW-gamma-L-alpha-aminoadipyl-6-phosphate reductase
VIPHVRASILGGSGYVGGEIVRLLLQHDHVSVQQVTSERYRGKFVHSVHPNLRGRTRLRFVSADELDHCDVLFTCLPHGESAVRMEALRSTVDRIIDLGADFRLRDPDRYARTYAADHPAPDLLKEFVYGLPELNRAALRGTALATGTGCSAAATILALLPLTDAGVLDPELPIVVDAKFGSSAAGNKESAGSHHPERSGVLRVFEPAGHRHGAEVEESCGVNVEMTGTSYDAVRGILATVHAFLVEDLDEMTIWKLYREAYADEPFVRIVKERTGIHRVPEPKILAGSNYCDLGFYRDPRSKRLVVISALDNLMKGAAGNAVQAMNLMIGFPETTGLGFPGLHPV